MVYPLIAVFSLGFFESQADILVRCFRKVSCCLDGFQDDTTLTCADYCRWQ
jgi:hypothetical protein